MNEEKGNIDQVCFRLMKNVIEVKPLYVVDCYTVILFSCEVESTVLSCYILS